MLSRDSKIGIIGAGGWGTALADILSENFETVKLWCFEPELAETINKEKENKNFLPDVKISDNVIATSKHEDMDDCEIFVFAVPTQFIRETLNKNHFDLTNKIIVNVSKGIEISSLERADELFHQVGNVDSNRFVVLTGPSHAEEAARKMPTAVLAASTSHSLAEEIQQAFSTPTFRVYSSDDVIGAEIGGALKNVIAVAAGVIDGLNLGDNTKAALITRGLTEIARLGVALGAKLSTFFGLSGLGDLTVTCNSQHSRNRFVGEQIGIGRKLKDIEATMNNMVAEGVATTKSAYILSQKLEVDMPIVEQMYRVLFEDVPPKQAIYELMTREYKKEWI